MSGYKLDRINVLVIDDNKHMRQLLKTLLSAYGVVNIYEAKDGGEGFEKLLEHEVDLVLCDLVMEPVDGFSFINRVRQGKDSPDPFIPIIIVSGYTERFRVTDARDYGATEVLAKPVSAKELAARITSCIETPRPFVRTKEYFGPDRRRVKRGDAMFSGDERRLNKFAIEEQLSMAAADENTESEALDDILDFDAGEA